MPPPPAPPLPAPPPPPGAWMERESRGSASAAPAMRDWRSLWPLLLPPLLLLVPWALLAEWEERQGGSEGMVLVLPLLRPKDEELRGWPLPSRLPEASAVMWCGAAAKQAARQAGGQI